MAAAAESRMFTKTGIAGFRRTASTGLIATLTSPLKFGQFTSRVSVLHTALATLISMKPQ
jgi:hypothetical protein